MNPPNADLGPALLAIVVVTTFLVIFWVAVTAPTDPVLRKNNLMAGLLSIAPLTPPVVVHLVHPAPILLLDIPSLIGVLFCPVYATLNLSLHMRAGISPEKPAPPWNRLILPAALLAVVELMLGVAYTLAHLSISAFKFLGASFLAIALFAFFRRDIANGMKAMGRSVDRIMTAMEDFLAAAFERTVNAATAASRTFGRALQTRLLPLLKLVVDPTVPIKSLEALGAIISAGFSAAFNGALSFHKLWSHSAPYQSPSEPSAGDDLPAAQSTEVALYNSKLPDTTQQFPVPEIPRSRPPEFLQLKLRRSQRLGFFGRVIFVLDARMELHSEELELVRKYRLSDNVIYESASRKRRKEASLAHLERTRDDTSRFSDSANTQLLAAGKTLYRLTRAGMSATAAALSLRITIRSLMAGVHVECKSMDELLGSEVAVLEAAKNLRSYLDTAATFDGQEEIFEF